MMELDTKLSNMKKERKDAKSQAKMLNNRINMSKNQERKNLRKIECCKKSVNDKILRFQQMIHKNIKQKQTELENKLNKDKILKEEMGSDIE